MVRLNLKNDRGFKSQLELIMSLDTIGSIDRGGFWGMLGPRGLIKGSEQQPRLSESHWEHTIEVTLGGRELGDLCPQRTGESWRGLSQAVAAICSDASSFHFICPFFLIKAFWPHLRPLSAL